MNYPRPPVAVCILTVLTIRAEVGTCRVPEGKSEPLLHQKTMAEPPVKPSDADVIAGNTSKHEERVSGAQRRRNRLRGKDTTTTQPEVETQPKLALPGPAFPSLDFHPEGLGRRLEIAGHAILVNPAAHPPKTTVHEILTATSVWNCAVVVAKYLELNQDIRIREAEAQKSDITPQEVDDDGGGRSNGAAAMGAVKLHRIDRSTKVLELGAGTGVAGIAAALLMRASSRDDSAHGSVLLTDVAAAVPGLAYSVALNAGEPPDLPARAGALDWTRCEDDLKLLGEDAPFDVVIAADVVWVTHLIPPLVRTLARVTGEGSVVVFGYQSRSSAADHELFAALRRVFVVEQVNNQDMHPVFRAPGTVEIYLMRKLPGRERHGEL